MCPAEGTQCLLHAGQQLGGLHQHAFAPAEDHIEIACWDARPRQLDRGLQHGKGERLHPIAVDGEVFHLHLGKGRVHVDIRNVAVQQVAELGLRDMETRLAVPQRVVAVEPQHPHRHRAGIYQPGYNQGVPGMTQWWPPSVVRWNVPRTVP